MVAVWLFGTSFTDRVLSALGHQAARDASGIGAVERWINVNAIQVITHHTSAVVVAVALFWFVGFVVQRLMHDTIMKRCVLLFDEFVLLCLFVYFAYELFLFL